MTLRGLLARIPKYALPVVVVVVESVAGFVVNEELGQLQDARHITLYILASGMVAYLTHLIVEYYRIPAEAIETWALVAKKGNRQVGQPMMQMVRWLELLEGFDKRGMSSRFVDELVESLDAMTVPRQVESIFLETLRKEIEAMTDLAHQRPVYRDHNTQYVYAAGVAKYYDTQAKVDTIYATALDTPSEFYGDHEEYFQKQEPLRTKTDSFVNYAEFEMDNLRIIRNGTATSGLRPARNPHPPTEKARMVIIDKKRLESDLSTEKFWLFVHWHAKCHFGLKFFIRDQVAAFGPKWYEEELMRQTGLPSQETIDDFIVYGEQCVFGRVDPEVKDKQVTLRLHYLRDAAAESDVITVYRDFFVRLWRDDRAHTLTDLTAFADFDARIRSQTKETEALGYAYFDAFKEIRKAPRVASY